MEESTQRYILHYFKQISFHSLMLSLEMVQQTLFFNKTMLRVMYPKELGHGSLIQQLSTVFPSCNGCPIHQTLNPIEHLWACLKLELHRRYPDTKTLRGSPDAIKCVLRVQLMEVWWDIGEEVLDRLIDSMSRRVEALLAAEGWYTDY